MLGFRFPTDLRQQIYFVLQHSFRCKSEIAFGQSTRVYTGLPVSVKYTGCGVGAEHRTSLPRNGNSPQPQRPGAFLEPADGGDPSHAPGQVGRRFRVRYRKIPKNWGSFDGRKYKMGGLSVTSILIIIVTLVTLVTFVTLLKIFFHNSLILFS